MEGAIGLALNVHTHIVIGAAHVLHFELGIHELLDEGSKVVTIHIQSNTIISIADRDG